MVLVDDEAPEQTYMNAFEPRIAIAFLIYRIMVDEKPNDPQSTERMRELLELIKDNEKDGIHERLNKSFQYDSQSSSGESLSSAEEKDENENDSLFETNTSSNTSESDLEIISHFKLTFSVIESPDRWYTVLRSSRVWFHLNDILEISKPTFVDLFKPSDAELRLLSLSNVQSLY